MAPRPAPARNVGLVVGPGGLAGSGPPVDDTPWQRPCHNLFRQLAERRPLHAPDCPAGFLVLGLALLSFPEGDLWLIDRRPGAMILLSDNDGLAGCLAVFARRLAAR
jgi:hypothetical protein